MVNAHESGRVASAPIDSKLIFRPGRTPIYWLLLFAWIAGHTEILVAGVNRIHALPWSCERLRNIRHTHDLLLPLVPALIIWRVGLSGPQLLLGGHWGDVPTGWKLFCAVCLLGFASLVVHAIRHVLKQRPRARMSESRQVHDIAADLGSRPLGDGPFQFMASIPGNQLFQLELSEKHYHVPDLPSRQGKPGTLSVLHISDIHLIGTPGHEYHKRVIELAETQQPDLIVFSGDLIDRQSLAESLPELIGRLTAPFGCYYILGNHDWFEDEVRIREIMDSCGWIDVAGRVVDVDVDGMALHIGGSEVPWMGSHPDFSTCHGLRLFVCHTPDYLDWARRSQVSIMLSGHNHGGQVVLPVIGPVFAPSRFGVRYASGDFFAAPTLLHVSRGLCGRHPLRWNCRPEITKLVFHCEADRT